MINKDKCKDFKSATKEDLETQIEKWIEENDNRIEILSKKYTAVTTSEIDISDNSDTNYETVYNCNIKYKELHPELLYNINFHFGEYMINSYYNTVNTVFSSIVDVFNPTNPLHYQVILLDKPITELEIHGMIKAYKDELISRENNHNLHADIIGEVIISKGTYNVKNDYIKIYGSNTTYIWNVSMYMEDMYKEQIFKNAKNILVIKFDIKQVPKRSLLDKILCRNYHSYKVLYDEFDEFD